MGWAGCVLNDSRIGRIMCVNNPLTMVTVKENTYFYLGSTAHSIKLTLYCYAVHTGTHEEIG